MVLNELPHGLNKQATYSYSVPCVKGVVSQEYKGLVPLSTCLFTTNFCKRLLTKVDHRTQKEKVVVYFHKVRGKNFLSRFNTVQSSSLKVHSFTDQKLQIF